jgi:hypothetical protein
VAAAAANATAPKKKPQAPKGPPAAVKTLVQNCDAHKFETTIHLIGPDGKPKDSKVRMCGVEGQSDAEWIRTLKDAVSKTSASSMPQTAKEQIVAAVNAEIERLSMPDLKLPEGADIGKLPKAAANTKPVAPLSRDYDALPPLPTASSVTPPNVLGPGPLSVPVARVTLRCALAGDEDRPTDCDSIDKDTVLVLRADDAFPAGLAVRFLRHGDERAELTTPALRPGQTAMLHLPPRVCAGVVRSKLEIQALGANSPTGTPGGTVGEYDLRC